MACLKARDGRPLASKRDLFRIHKIDCKKSSPLLFGRGFVRRPWRALRLGMGTLWQASGIYLESTTSLAKKSPGPFFLDGGFARRPWRNLRLGTGAPWQTNGVHFESIKSLAKKFQAHLFWTGVCTAPTACLIARDGRPLASERDLFRIYKIACKRKPVPYFLEWDLYGAHGVP